MYCTKCGMLLPANARFCPNCGAPAPLVADAPTPVSSQDTAAVHPTSPTPAEPQVSSAQKPNRRNLTIVLCCATVAAAVLAILVTSQPKSPTASTVSSVPVGVKVSAPNYAAETDSPLPLRVTGTTSTGDAVNEVHFVKLGDATLYMPPGTYKLSLAASPLLASGDVYDTSTTVDLNVPAANSSPEQPQEQQAATQEQAPTPSNANTQAAAPAQQTVALELTPKDPAAVTDDDISDATTYAKQAADDETTDYSYSDDTVMAVIASVEEKRSMSPYADILEQYQAADAGGDIGPLVNATPFQEARTMAQNDPTTLSGLSQADLDRYNLTVGTLRYTLDDVNNDDTPELLVAYVWNSGGNQGGTSGNMVPYRLVDLYTADGSTPRRIMPTDSSSIVPCTDGTFVDFLAGNTGERYTRGEDGTYTTEALSVSAGSGVESYGLREDFSWTPVADFKGDSRIDEGTAATGTSPTAQSNTTQADVWHYSDDYISVDLPASWQGIVQLSPMGHASGAYHVDGSISAMGPASSVIRFDGTKGEANISFSFYDGCGHVIWQAIRKQSIPELSLTEALEDLKALTNDAVTEDDVTSMDEGAFAAKVKDAMQAYAEPLVSGSLQAR